MRNSYFNYRNRPDSLDPDVKSGMKYRSENGISAIRNGIKQNPNLITSDTRNVAEKPPWLKVRLATSPRYSDIKRIVKAGNLATVCEESHCPNIGECWSHGTATLMLMGSICTRACPFCAVDTGNPHQGLDAQEPARSAEAVRLMDLNYVVLTSVDRDDLPLGGAKHYADCIKAIHQVNAKTTIEALTPDFQGNSNAVATVAIPELSVFAHNIETVRRLTSKVRDPRANYDQSLSVLRQAKKPYNHTKSSIMLGLGEQVQEIKDTMADLRSVGVSFLTLGQYLRPTRNHLPVERYVHPDEFSRYRDWGREMGFLEVMSGPLVRSSYRADKLATQFI